MKKEVIASNATLVVPDAALYHFGVLTSAMHNAWMRTVAGRLKSDYRYSNKLVYNNFPWPAAPTERQTAKIETLAKAVLDARAKYPQASLAHLYNPQTMPPDLADAHKLLDRAVDNAYRRPPFADERSRVEFLFAEYAKLTAPALPAAKKRRRRKK